MREESYRESEDVYWAAYGVQSRDEEVVEIPSMETSVRVQMFGEGEPLLFVHGGPNAGTAWAPLVSRLHDRRCIVIDRPGCGLSPPVDHDRASYQEIASTVLAETLDGVGIESTDIVASSLGGAWTFWLAVRHPGRVKNIVQMSCPAFIPDMDMKAALFLRLLGLPVIGAALTMMPPTDFGIDQTFRNMGHGASLDAGKLPPEFFEWAKSLMADTPTMGGDRQSVQKGMTFWGIRPEVVLDDDMIGSIEQGTHWFWGEADPFASVAAAKRLVDLMPNATIEVLEDGGHLPWLDDPARAERAVRMREGRDRPSLAS